VNLRQLLFSVASVALSAVVLFGNPLNQWFVKRGIIWMPFDGQLLGAILVVFFVDGYLVLLLRAVVYACRIADDD
jgi:hypothetical protein